MATEHSCACCDPAGGEPATAAGGDAMPCYCPLDGVIETVGRKYSLRIVGLLGARGPMRYGELEEVLEVSSTSTLADRLDQLAAEDLIERRSFDEVPPRVEYSLTPRGRELEHRLEPLLEWAATA